MGEFTLPPRYEALAPLGQGGGGVVWAVRDRVTGQSVALKALSEHATEYEAEALVREAIALSGLEGLGAPKVLRFGRLPATGSPYMVRELVEGRSLVQLLEEGAAAAVVLEAVAEVADQLTVLHRAGLLHGDVKPANVIVGPEGRATLVDFGLAAPWLEHGAKLQGWTPRYAAPELLAGGPLSVRAEIFALGATLAEAVAQSGACGSDRTRPLLDAVIERATAPEPLDRFPSADEMAAELRRAAKLSPRLRRPASDAAWPIVGIDRVAGALLARVEALEPRSSLAVVGPSGAGKSALLRRVAWTLGVAGRAVAWVEAETTGDVAGALELEMAASAPADRLVFIDDAGSLSADAKARLEEARREGARVVLSAERGGGVDLSAASWPMPPLEDRAAGELVLRAIPSLSPPVIAELVARAEGRPGRLRAMVRRLEGQTVVAPADLARILSQDAGTTAHSAGAEPTSARCARLLDQGRYDEAATLLAELEPDRGLSASILRARLWLARGDASQAMEALRAVEKLASADPSSSAGRAWALYTARAELRMGDYAQAKALATRAAEGAAPTPVTAEAWSVVGLAESYTGQTEEALSKLDHAVAMARQLSDGRALALSLASRALVLQRADRLGEARKAYESALEAAEASGDAGSVATIRLNLAVLVQSQGDFAQAIDHLEAAIDMGQRAGRRTTVQQALLNLANLDLYLGRFARARESIERLAGERDALAPVGRAQLLGLEADLSARTGKDDEAVALYQACAGAYRELGRGSDAAEAALEQIVLVARLPGADVASLAALFEEAERALEQAPAHRALLELTRGALARLEGKVEAARDALEHSLAAARSQGQRDWIWRILDARARLAAEQGAGDAGRADLTDALAVLESIAGSLPRDLREVFWDDARRRELRARAEEVAPVAVAAGASPARPEGRHRGPLNAEDRLGRILEINREIAVEHDLPRLLDRITDHAIALSRAERGMVILAAAGGELSVQASRDRQGDDPHARFSRSIAERVLRSGEAIVSQSVRDDENMAGYASVHQLLLQSVACIPIAAPGGRPIGALYLETRTRPGLHFSAELPTLRAFADQVAIAIENARLVTEAASRARELEIANGELTAARARLDDLLAQRTAQLDEARRDLRTTRAVLRSHFGYHGLVGTSAAMRKLYALVDRVKDTDVPVLITGESGTGKEVVARAVHQASVRAKHSFTGINCGAIPEHLLESELFGHLRGAFTGADRERKGLFRESEGGTLLLDEIGEMPKKMQASLLRVLQEKVVRPVGGPKEIPVDVRLIAATNRDLSAMVEEGSFREDLYYRLHVVEVCLPPLRERIEDLPILIDHFFKIFAARFHAEKKTISRDALRRLSGYAWPGNVRQLENVLLSAWVMSDKPELAADDFDLPQSGRGGGGSGHPVTTSAPRVERANDAGALPSRARRPEPPDDRAPATTSAKSSRADDRTTRSNHGPPSRPPSSNGRSTLVQHKHREKERILSALNACNWNRVQAAKRVGLPRRTFYRRLKEYGIQ